MNIIKKAEYDTLSDELGDILETMEIPKSRSSDYRWMARNLGINNGSHPKLERATEILRIFLNGEEL